MIYYSDKYSNENGEQLPPVVWSGVFSYISRCIDSGALGASFPLYCPDGNFIYGTDSELLFNSMKAHIPDIVVPLTDSFKPTLLQTFDIIEYIHQFITKPNISNSHPYYQHNHYSFDKIKGQREFEEEINTIFRRNQVRYMINQEGNVIRTVPDEIDTLLNFKLVSGDTTLDRLLEEGRKRFLHPDIKERKIGLEKVWDAWERIKSLEDKDKKKSIKLLLAKAASESNYLEVLELEAIELTKIGNNFDIRHFEQDTIPIERESQIDYLFIRNYSLIVLLLRERSSPIL